MCVGARLLGHIQCPLVSPFLFLTYEFSGNDRRERWSQQCPPPGTARRYCLRPDVYPLASTLGRSPKAEAGEQVPARPRKQVGVLGWAIPSLVSHGRTGQTTGQLTRSTGGQVVESLPPLPVANSAIAQETAAKQQLFPHEFDSFFFSAPKLILALI